MSTFLSVYYRSIVSLIRHDFITKAQARAFIDKEKQLNFTPPPNVPISPQIVDPYAMRVQAEALSYVRCLEEAQEINKTQS